MEVKIVMLPISSAGRSSKAPKTKQQSAPGKGARRAFLDEDEGEDGDNGDPQAAAVTAVPASKGSRARQYRSRDE
jgi:hypothetical protein